jgi:hypothetical protein
VNADGGVSSPRFRSFTLLGVTYDYSRTKTALVGCFGVMAVLLGALFVSLQRMQRRPPTGPPCLRGVEALQPLLIGDTARMSMGTSRNGDCTSKTAPGFVWSSSDTTIASITPDGFVRGHATGLFRLTAERASGAFFADGFVLPADWRVRIIPDSARLRVGDSVKVAVRAFTKTGEPLPVLPFELHSPESFDPLAGKKPIVNRLRWLAQRDPVVVVAVDTGTTTLIGRIGFQQVTAKLKIVK